MDSVRDRWATSIVLSDGDTAFLRPITAADGPLLLELHRRQPSDDLYKRFFSPKPTLSAAELAHFTDIDFRDRVALAVEHRGQWIAWASYERWPGRDDAEVAFLVDAAHHGRGIATILLEHLAAIARSSGISRFTAETLADNRPMLRVFSRAGWPLQKHFESGLTEIEFPLLETEHFVDSVEAREHRADSQAIARLLLPKSIAVIGASDRLGTIGHEVWQSATTFAGPVFPVNHAAEAIGGRQAYRSVVDIPDDVWLAVIAVPAASLRETIDSCIAKRVRGAVVLTAIDGTDVDIASIVAHARRHGLRIIGPASMGVATTRSGGLQAALVPLTLPSGSIAISMQSGTLGASLLQLALHLEMGVSWFVSLGDKSDVSGNDLLQFWADDDSTRVIAMYTETFGNPRKFARIARRVGRTKPIVAVRTGAAAIGSAADALYQQAGVIEVPTVRALLDTARVLASQPIPSGPNVAIVTNARSPGVLATAAVVAAGLTPVPAPVALDWRSTRADFGRAVQAAVHEVGVDAVLVIHAPPISIADAPAVEIDHAAQGSSKPVIAVMLGRDDGPVHAGSVVPSFSFPEPAAAALGRMYAHGRWLLAEADPATETLAGTDAGRVEEVIEAAVSRTDPALTPDETAQLFALYGMFTPTSIRLVAPAVEELVTAADTVGYPVVVKAARRRVGRSAQAGIALDLGDAHAVREALAVMRSSLGADAESVVVQRMVLPGVDVRIHCTTDERLGPVVTLDVGSQQSARAAEGPSRLPPLSRATAEAMVGASRVGDALTAAGLPADPLVETIRRVAQLMFDHAELDEIDINPAIVSAGACAITDARIVIAPASTSELPLRRLG